MLRHLTTALIPLALIGCDTMIDPTDTQMPNVSMSLVETGLPLIFHTDPAQTPVTSGCAPGTSKKAQFAFIPDELIYVTNGGNQIELLVSFGDKSGIENATIKFPIGPIESPDNTTLSTIGHGSQDTGQQVRLYTFNGDPANPKTPHLVSIKHTPSDANRVYNFTARDFVGNSRINTFFAVGNQASLCQ